MAKKFYGTGRRKTSVARVTLIEGSGSFTFNGKDISQYFPSPSMKMTIEKPFKVVNREDNFDVIVNFWKWAFISIRCCFFRHIKSFVGS